MQLGPAPSPPVPAVDEPTPAIRLLPTGGVRAALLMLVTVLALCQVGSGVAVAEAWRSDRRLVTPRPQDLARLDELWWRLRALEQAAAVGVVLLAALWTFLALANVRRAGGGGRRAALGALAWCLPAAAVVVLARADVAERPDHWRWAAIVVPLVLAAIPLHLASGGAVALGGSRLEFRRLHLALAAAFSVQQLERQHVDLTDRAITPELGRLAIMHVTVGLLLALVVLAVADATRTLQTLVDARVERQRLNEENAALRFRLHAASLG